MAVKHSQGWPRCLLVQIPGVPGLLFPRLLSGSRAVVLDPAVGLGACRQYTRSERTRYLLRGGDESGIVRIN